MNQCTSRVMHLILYFFDDLKVNCEVLLEAKVAPAQRKVTRYNFTKTDYDKKEANFL